MTTFKCYNKTDPKLHTGAIKADNEFWASAWAEILLGTPQANILVVEQLLLTCPKCSYRWKSAGRRKIHATCPECMKQVRIAEARK